MQQPLPNNCTLSKITVTPENWEKPNAKLNIQWEISYRFKDCTLNKTHQERRFIPKKYCTWQDRKLYVEKFLKLTEEKIIEQGYNPVTKEYFKASEATIEDSKHTLRSALEYAFSKLKATNDYIINVRSAKKQFLIAAGLLNYDNELINVLSRKHMKRILEQCGKLKVTWNKKILPIAWNNARYNDYRAMLSSLFKILLDEEIIEHNIMSDVPKLKTIRKKRKIITKAERKLILESDHVPFNFKRYIIMFFHSGARSTELLTLKKEDVNLEEQQFTALVKKAGEEQDKPIKTIALHYWKEMLEQARPGQYIFSKDLQPGNTSISPRQITIRWRKYVKKKLGIDKDFYSLKHANADEVAELYDIETAQKLIGHSTPVITADFYALGEKKRQHEKLKAINNEF
jgi:integrase